VTELAPLTTLIIDDDKDLAASLARSLTRRGFQAHVAGTSEEGLTQAAALKPAYALVDLKMPGASGLECVKGLHALDPDMRIVVLTGYASINTAVQAIKLGAVQYLAKPANADEIIAAFEHKEPSTEVALTPRPTSIKTLEWERIHEMLVETDYNISATARRLGMHRRTLTRKLAKKPVT